jgi:DNA-directed RNA polymerase subunit M/transcription elongation factor TFIIS
MTEGNSRYSGPPTTLYSYMKEFAVECPKCKGEALVTTDGSFKLDNGRLTCRNCMYSQEASELIRYRSIVKRYCDECGKAFEAIYPSQKEPASRITVPCPHCGILQDYKPKIEEYKQRYQASGFTVDPYIQFTFVVSG